MFSILFVLVPLVDLVSLNVCQHCSCTSVHILCTPANVVTSALAQVFSKTVIYGIESQHSFNLVAEQWSHLSGEGKLNFRHAERHMPGMFNGKATEYTEYIFKMEAYMSTIDPAGKGGEILRAAATEVKDMDDAEVANLAAIYWNVSALNSALASSLITTTTGEVGTLALRVLQALASERGMS